MSSSLVAPELPRFDTDSNQLTEKLSLRVLVVDDELDLREILYEFISSLGCEVTTAPNGKDALTIMTKASFDIVLTDIQMPLMNGDTMIQEIQRTMPVLPEIFVITGKVAAKDPSSILKPGIRARVSGVIVKPFNLDDIERVLRKVALPS